MCFRQDSLAEIRLGQPGFGELRSGEVRAAQLGLGQVGPAQVGTEEVGVAQVPSRQVAAGQDDAGPPQIAWIDELCRDCKPSDDERGNAKRRRTPKPAMLRCPASHGERRRHHRQRREQGPRSDEQRVLLPADREPAVRGPHCAGDHDDAEPQNADAPSRPPSPARRLNRIRRLGRDALECIVVHSRSRHDVWQNIGFPDWVGFGRSAVEWTPDTVRPADRALAGLLAVRSVSALGLHLAVGVFTHRCSKC